MIHNSLLNIKCFKVLITLLSENSVVILFLKDVSQI